MRKVGILSTSRADYGILRWILEDMKDSSRIEPHLIVTGSHLLESRGSTLSEVRQHDHTVHAIVPFELADDSRESLAAACGSLVGPMASLVQGSELDLLLVVGDRAEVLACALGAYYADISIAHLHGGELTAGSMDDSMRHAISKLSSLHFAAAQPYADRIIRLGENPERVFVVGAPGLDSLERRPLLDRQELSKVLGLSQTEPFVVCTFHPYNASSDETASVLNCALDIVEKLFEGTILVTGSNIDVGSQMVRLIIDSRVKNQTNRYVFQESLGHETYLSALAHANFVLGNSSSGIIEAPALNVATVNIGKRQEGRLRSDSVFDASNSSESIEAAIKSAQEWHIHGESRGFGKPYGSAGASKAVVELLEVLSYPTPSRKEFYDGA